MSDQILRCPECVTAGRAGRSRIGTRRTECHTCNAFARRVDRLTAKRLKEADLERYERERREAEASLYPKVLEDWQAKNPGLSLDKMDAEAPQ